MATKQDLLKKVKYHFGLNVYESKVWLALLNRNIASVGEIAEASGVPRSRVYDVLESLEKQGFAISKLGKPVKYIAVKPAVVLERLKSKILRETDSKVKVLSNLKETREFRDLVNLYSNGIEPVQPHELSAAVRGRANIYGHIKDLVADAKKEVILVSNINELKRKSHFLKPIFEKLKSNNVRILVASSASEKETKGTFLTVSKMLGVPIKRVRVNGRFCIVDGHKSLLTITPEAGEEDLAILLNSPFFNKAMSSFLIPSLRAA